MNAPEQQAEDQEIDQLLANADESASRQISPDSIASASTVDKLRGELETIAVNLREPIPAEHYEDEPACARAVELAAAIAQKPVVKPAEPISPKVVDVDINGLGEVGPYKLLELLGQGGMGAVYKALHPRLEKIVALKVLRAGLIKSDALDRFDREMKALGKLDHPHLIRALDAGDASGTHYLVMEFVSGMDLSALIAMREKLPVADACELIVQAAMGLHAAHSRGMIHRDIKPANLMLAEQEFGPPIVKVLDLGLALLSESSQPDAGGLTSDGQIMGTIDYMPPEQAQDSHTVDERADIYSLGATLYALLTGGSVFHGRPHTTLMQKLMALATESVPPIRERRPDVSEPLARIVHRMLARDPKQRFASMAEVIAALKPFAVGANLSALIAGESDQTVVLQADSQSNAFGEPGGVSPRTLAETVVVEPIVREQTPPGSPGRSGVGTNRRTAIAAAVAGVLLLGAILFSIKTPNGEIIVNVDGLSVEELKQIEIKVSGNGETKIANEANGWTIGVKQDGKYDVELTGGKDRVQVDKNQVTVTRRDKAIVTVSLKPNGAAMSANTPKGTKPTGGANSDVERHAAEWLQSLNEGDWVNLTIEIVGGQMTTVGNRQLPAVPFHVRHINLEGPIIDQLGDRLADELPAKIGGIRVHSLWIHSRTLTTAGFAKLVAMPEFSETSRINLVCVDPGMDDGVLPLIAKLPDLKAVTIVAKSHLTGAGIGELKACAELSEIEWQQWQHGSLSATAVEELTQLPKLHKLSFNNFTCTERHMMAIAKLKLRQLGFHASKVDDRMLRHLATMEKLETLGITHNPITDQGLSELKQIKTLKTLDIRGTKITAAGIADLQQALPNCKIERDAPAPTSDPATERRLAEWVLGVKGRVTVRTPKGESLDVNRLKDLPKEPFTLTGLWLGVGGNDNANEISNEDCRQFAALSALELLDLGGQSITAEGLAHFTGCSELKELRLYRGGVGVDAIPIVAKFTKLETFMLQWMESDKWAEALANMPSLRKVTAYRTDITDAGVAHLARLPKLVDLTLSDCTLTDASLKSMASCKSLKSLTLDCDSFTWPEIKHLRQELPECKITNNRLFLDPNYQFAQWLKSLPPPVTFDVSLADGSQPRIGPEQSLPEEPLRVATLFLQGPALDQPGNTLAEEFAKRMKGTTLGMLQLGSPMLTTEQTSQFLQIPEMSDLKVLSLGSEEIDDGIVESLARLKKVTHLELRCPKMTTKGLSQLRELTSLEINGPANVTPEGFEDLGQLSKLTHLQIGRCPFTERHVEAISKLKLNNLQAYDAGITDAMLKRLTDIKTLQVLALVRNPITDAGLPELKKLNGLTTLHLMETNITAAGVADLQKALPNCKIEWDAPKE